MTARILPFILDKIEARQRAAQLGTCRHCGALTYLGWDDDRCAAWAQVDTEPVDKLHEVVALLRGLHSYDLVGDPPRLYHREPEHVRAKEQRYDVLLTHRCERPT